MHLFWADVGEQEQEKIRELINRLLATNFLVKEKEREAYLLARRHRQRLADFFQLLGWEFQLDERHECLFVQPPQAQLRRRLNREESVFMLIMRLIYQEKRQSLSLSEFPLTTTHEIRTKYETFRLPWIQRTKLEEMVRLCTKYHLLEALDQDVRADECRFRLFHTWQYVIRTEDVLALKERLARYDNHKEGLFDEMAEETALD